MTFVSHPDLKWDVFISYAEVDNSEGWVTRFHEQLSIKLDQLSGRTGQIQFWRDTKLDTATGFDAVLKKRVEQSAVFLALCSAGYLRSEQCRSEFETFREHYGDEGLRVNDRSRIVRLRLQNIAYDDLPSTPDRSRVFDFFAWADDDPIGSLLETDSPNFRGRVDQLSKTVFQILSDLGQPPGLGRVESPRPTNGVRPQESAATTTQRKEAGSVFISYAREDSARVEALAHALESQGWSIWWDRSIPAGRNYREVISEALENARCVVVAWSKVSIKSRWVIEEAQDGVERDILVPVFLDEVRPPLGFRELQGAMLVEWDGDESDSRFKRLASDIQGRLGT